MPIDKIEYILIGDGKDIQTPTKTFTIHLPPIKVKIPEKQKTQKKSTSRLRTKWWKPKEKC